MYSKALVLAVCLSGALAAANSALFDQPNPYIKTSREIEAMHDLAERNKNPQVNPYVVTTAQHQFPARDDDDNISNMSERASIQNPLLPFRNRVKLAERNLKDAFMEDYSFMVKVRVVYNVTTSAYCSGVVLDPEHVLTDVSCIKYHGMANIEPKYLRVMHGELNNETIVDVEQIYVNRLDLNDAHTELALLKLQRSIVTDLGCKKLEQANKNTTIETDLPVKVLGFLAQGFELKEVRTKVGKRDRNSRYICTLAADQFETTGNYLMRGAALFSSNGCNNLTLIGILTRVDSFSETSAKTKHQDCFVAVGAQANWILRVRQLTSETNASN